MTLLRTAKKISKATAKRFPVYLRYLKILESSGVIRIRSNEFAELTKIPSTTIRRDFSQLGELGRSGYGYEVAFLIEALGSILAIYEEKRIALIGYGNLGKALANNNFRRNENLNIVCIFDNDPAVIQSAHPDQPVYSMQELDRVVKETGASVAISTVPSKYSQQAIDQIVSAGITAILNFAPDHVNVPKHVHIQSIDLTTELQSLILFDHLAEHKE